MKKKEYLELVERELKNIRDVIERKNNDYTGDTDSAFANFEATSSLGLSDARMGVLIRVVDKIQRVKTFVQKGELKVKGESAQDAARDIIGYSLILLGMLEPKGVNEEKKGKKAPLMLEAGKMYRRRDGLLVGPLQPESDKCTTAQFFTRPFPEDENPRSYLSDGTHARGQRELDLICEVER